MLSRLGVMALITWLACVSCAPARDAPAAAVPLATAPPTSPIARPAVSGAASSPPPTAAATAVSGPSLSISRSPVILDRSGRSEPFNVVFTGFPVNTPVFFSLFTDSAGVVSEAGEIALPTRPSSFTITSDPFVYELRIASPQPGGRVLHLGRGSLTFLVDGRPRGVQVLLAQ